jgi:hypothetical protein
MNLVFSTVSVKKNDAFQAGTHVGLQLILNTFQFLLYFHFVSDKERGSWLHNNVHIFIFQLLKELTHRDTVWYNTCIYPAYRHTQHKHASKVTTFALFTVHHQTYTYRNVWKELYNRLYNLEKATSSFTNVERKLYIKNRNTGNK